MIEKRIMNRINTRNLNEYATYVPNQLMAEVIGHHITHMGFYYPAVLNEPNSEEVGVSVKLNVELNQDDIDVMMSENVIYCFINSDKIDFTIETDDHSIYDIVNFGDIIKSNHFVPNNPKAWRDSTKLYLLKINLNSGIIGRYDVRTGRFKNQEINWNFSTPKEVVELLLTKPYLEEYFRSELSSLESYVNFVTKEMMVTKEKSEMVID